MNQIPSPPRLIVIGASLSGINALSELVKRLPPNLPAAVMIVQHVAAHSPGMLPQILSSAGPLPATHPNDGQKLLPGHIYVAPPDRHMLVSGGSVRLSHGPKENMTRPAIDPLFRSAALAYGHRAIGVILTGQLDDGTAGLLAIKDRGGITVVQNPQEATAPSMPRSALRRVPVDYQASLQELGTLLGRLAAAPPPEDPTGSDLLMEIESRIAAGDFRVADWWDLENMSKPSGLNCPDCRSALYELDDKRVLRFRCRSGHAFSADSLASAQSEARYNLLSSIFGALIEESTLLRRLSEGEPAMIAPMAAARYRTEAGRLQGQTEVMCEWLRSMAGLVEPEPDSPAAGLK